MDLNPNLTKIAISGIRQFMAEASQVDDVVHLTIGQPDFPTPTHIKQAAIQAINNNETGYTLNAGKKELRQSVSNFLNRKHKLIYNPDDEIIVTNGATQALDLAFRTILTPGDEVIIPAPIYPGYSPIIHLCGATPVYVDTTKTNFKLTVEDLKKVLTPKTKAILFPYPNNPTGAMLDEAELAELATFLIDQDVYLVSDEIYSEILYTDSYSSIVQFKGMQDKTLLIQGLSKSHAMTGWRIGFLLGPKEIIKEAIKVHQYNITCASSISQCAAVEALTNGLEDPILMSEEYKQRRDYLVTQLLAMGFKLQIPEATFYIFVDHRNFEENSLVFARRLLHEAKVAVTPGSAFDPYGNGFVRLSFATSLDEIKKACSRLSTYLNNA